MPEESWDGYPQDSSAKGQYALVGKSHGYAWIYDWVPRKNKWCSRSGWMSPEVAALYYNRCEKLETF